MVANNGNNKGLFSGAIMESGSPIPLSEVQTRWFDFLANATNCSTAADRLDCLRKVPDEILMDRINQSPHIFSYEALNLPWTPMVDGKFLVQDPFIAVQQGKYTKIPFITGDDEDEGTRLLVSVFGYGSLNVTTEALFLAYIKSTLLPDATQDQLRDIVQAYPEDPAQIKRLAAFHGHFYFQAPRRFFLQTASKTQSTYAYRYLRGATSPGLGSYHGADTSEFFRTKNPDYAVMDSAVFFTSHQDPNAPKSSISLLANITWPKWTWMNLD
ncbi:Alpha/Beta hydrolase protein [Crepidotus variabilis]|uniref:Alpha/Beta hydrolase protein n=1 Tax=Crepidotus variabilis TaxID=179855 RepID=A0A9P6EJ65_9AGAR|nr:Alpha/Beta hydrolase protein [Crepidotus variabilis]